VTNDEYLAKVLEAQRLKEDGDELKALREHREEVEEILREHFPGSKPTIRYGGSKAKGTMILEAYDLDIICYFEHEDDGAGTTLKEICRNVQERLAEQYYVVPKRSALRLMERDPKGTRADFHIDVVPGRFTDDTKSDAYIHQEGAEKSRLKTNIQKHIDHIGKSGLTDAIKLLKLWNVRNHLQVKTFVLELLAVKLLAKKKAAAPSKQLVHVWTEFRDNADDLSVEDPANPEGNDLTPLLDGCRSMLSMVAKSTLAQIESAGWEQVFGKIEEEEEDTRAALRAAAVQVVNPTRPWRK